MVRPAQDFKRMNVGLRKRLSFSAIRTKHKESLGMLSFFAEETPQINDRSDFRSEINVHKVNTFHYQVIGSMAKWSTALGLGESHRCHIAILPYLVRYVV